jgi:hypothetical protein
MIEADPRGAGVFRRDGVRGNDSGKKMQRMIAERLERHIIIKNEKTRKEVKRIK